MSKKRTRSDLAGSFDRSHFNGRGRAKVAYETEDAALADIKRHDMGTGYTAYLCEECSKWHIGFDKSAAPDAEKQTAKKQPMRKVVALDQDAVDSMSDAYASHCYPDDDIAAHRASVHFGAGYASGWREAMKRVAAMK